MLKVLLFGGIVKVNCGGLVRGGDWGLGVGGWLFATDKINLTQRRKDRRENLFVLFVQQSYSLCVLCVLSEQGERALRAESGLGAETGDWGLDE